VVVEEEQFDSRMDLGSPTMLGLCSDTADGAFYAFDENFIYEVRTIVLSLLGGARFRILKLFTILLKLQMG
jgi:hypothetical protein